MVGKSWDTLGWVRPPTVERRQGIVWMISNGFSISSTWDRICHRSLAFSCSVAQRVPGKILKILNVRSQVYSDGVFAGRDQLLWNRGVYRPARPGTTILCTLPALYFTTVLYKAQQYPRDSVLYRHCAVQPVSHWPPWGQIDRKTQGWLRPRSRDSS